MRFVGLLRDEAPRRAADTRITAPRNVGGRRFSISPFCRGLPFASRRGTKREIGLPLRGIINEPFK